MQRDHPICLLLDASDDIAFLLDDDFHVVTCNRRAAEKAEASPASLEGCAYEEILHRCGAEECNVQQHMGKLGECLRKDAPVVYENAWAGIDWRSTFKPLDAQDGKRFLAVFITDISRENAMRAELEQSARFQQILLDGLSLPVFYKNIDSVYQGCNKAFEAMIGKPRSRIIGHSVFNMGYDEELARKYHARDQALFNSNAETQQYEGRVTWHDGTVHDVVFAKRIYRDAQGRKAGLIGAVFDITDRKRAEHALSEREANLSLIVETMTDCVWLLDRDFNFTYITPSSQSLIGRTPDELLGQNLFELLTPASVSSVRQQIGEHLKRIAAGQVEPETIRHVLQFVHADGSWRWMEVVTKPLVEKGRMTGCLGVTRDYQQAQQALEGLRQSERRFKAIFAAANIGICITNIGSGRNMLCNGHLAVMLGYDLYELQDMEIAALFPVDRRKAVMREYERRVRGETGYSPEVPFTRKNGEVIYFDVSSVHIDMDGPCLISFMVDVTDRQRYIKQLQVSKEAAESANKTKNTFLANMSHEIRTPLNGILGMTQLIAEAGVPQEQQVILDNIKMCGESLLGILSDVIDISRIEAGMLIIQNKPIDLHALVRTMAAMHKVDASRKKLDLSCRIADNVPQWMYGDALRLRQIVGNLLGNAIKYTESGEISVLLSRREQNGRAILVLTVGDTGIGISRHDRKNIFETFYKVENGKGKVHDGTGLGLAIVARLVKLIDGRIDGQGSRFNVMLPLHPATPPEPAPAPTPPATPAAQEQQLRFDRILIVEDEPVSCMLLERLASRFTGNLDVACNGREALESFQRHRQPVILMDVNMPVMDGYETTRAIRRQAQPEHQPVIVALTAYAMQGDEDACLEAGMNDYLTKPINIKALTAMLKKHHRRSVQE